MMILVKNKKKNNHNFLHILFLFCVEIIKPATLQTPAIPAPHITCVSGLKPSTHHLAVTDPNVVVKTVIWMNLKAELTGCVTCEGRV